MTFRSARVPRHPRCLFSCGAVCLPPVIRFMLDLYLALFCPTADPSRGYGVFLPSWVIRVGLVFVLLVSLWFRARFSRLSGTLCRGPGLHLLSFSGV